MSIEKTTLTKGQVKYKNKFQWSMDDIDKEYQINYGNYEARIKQPNKRMCYQDYEWCSHCGCYLSTNKSLIKDHGRTKKHYLNLCITRMIENGSITQGVFRNLTKEELRQPT
jgi:hypothetical protein